MSLNLIQNLFPKALIASVALALASCSLLFTPQEKTGEQSLVDASPPAARCGDGLLQENETCDDSNAVGDDGCSSLCQVEVDWSCLVVGEACRKNICGDGYLAGNEECEDQNVEGGDGCSFDCKLEPQCSGGTCVAICGDGFVTGSEECDDDNLVSGDGCSSECAVEDGFGCTQNSTSLPPSIQIAMTARDFIAACDVTAGDSRLEKGVVGAIAPYGHPDFQCFGSSQEGMVSSALGSDGKPVRSSVSAQNTSVESFALWYRTDPDYNRPIGSNLVLQKKSGNMYKLDKRRFFPLTNEGFDIEDCGAAKCESLHTASGGVSQNFHFTTESRMWFQFSGAEKFHVSGDDDVWVFINNRLAIDMGGIHSRRSKTADLSDPSVIADLDLTQGNIYEVVIFKAERRTNSSSLGIRLEDFTHPTSVCTAQ